MGAFMDDVTLFHMGDQNLSLPKLQEMTSREVQLWIDMLWAAGGKSNLDKDKTYTSIIIWAFNEDGASFLMPQPNFSPRIQEPLSGPQV